MSKIKVNSISSLSGQKVEFPNGVSGDGSGLYFQPNVISFDPVATSTGISTTTNITILFDQDVEFSGVGTIYIREDSPSGTISTYFTCGVSTEATIAGSTLVIDPRDPLSFGQLYVVTLPSVGIANTYGQYHRGTQGYSFTTAAQAFSASGGNSEFTIASPTSPTGYHKYHVFTSTGILTTTAPSFDADDLYSILVAGGGAGNFSGGGAGGVFKNTGPELTLSVGTYTVTIGAGGATSSTYFLNPTVTPDFGDGENSTISTSPTNVLVSAYGGGRGSLNNGPSTPNPIIIAGNPGGSGGGSHGTPAGTLGGTGIPGQGNSGGQGSPPPVSFSRIGSGGGGAGGAGSSGNIYQPPTSNLVTATAGSGGAGTPVPQFTSSIIGGRVPSIPTATITEIGTSGLYGGGGGGGTPQDVPTWPIVFTGGTGGVGGGGNGYILSPPVTRPNESGFTNTGGGGGGGAHVIVPGSPTGTWLTGGAGGSGVFMIRYAVPVP